ncbi:hypothetical protein CAPN002_23790 [Capnocytophaga stomatis]|uniref:pyocin knob domain-containing protein n=1 Tax=Capnocytophaga stomatis TaxID=1848904 RepID=UPI0019517651|nr:pyocin knob domain-containing protein [Capnocytophaga stomatis]GIJ95161.1 hypothetical protein CAPN002_23790 [Capnocytophaga stomatis]
MKTKIVQQIPVASALEASTLYLVQKEEGFEIHITDDNKAVKKLLSIPDAPNDGKEYLRFNNTWKAFTGWQFRQLSDTEHLDDIKYPGLFGQYNSGAVTIARGFPNDEARGGHILSLPMTLNPSTLTLFHVFFSAGTKNAGDYTNVARIYMRAFVNNSHWLPWREFDGGKVHTLTDAVQNISKAFKGFPTNDSTFVIDKATTVTVPKNYGIIKYVKNTSENLTFSPASGVDIIGDKVVTAPIGSLVHLICSGTMAFVYCDKNIDTSSFITKNNDGTKLLKSNGENQNLSEVFINRSYINDIQPSEVNTFWYRDTGMYQVQYGGHSEILLHFNTLRGSASALQLRSSYQDNTPLMVRKFVDNGRATVWKSLAWNDDLASKGASWLGAEWTAPAVIFTSTVFLTGSGNKTIHLHQMQDQSILSFKKCYDGGTVTFTCAGKQIIMKGATSFNGADGSNAVVTIVGNKCYIDINNY